jgi:hypothetical protein
MLRNKLEDIGPEKDIQIFDLVELCSPMWSPRLHSSDFSNPMQYPEAPLLQF